MSYNLAGIRTRILVDKLDDEDFDVEDEEVVEDENDFDVA